jgi:chloramphenicol O-acetyltransferase type B
LAFYLQDVLAQGIREHGWSIGAHSYGAPNVQNWGVDGDLRIGRYCSVAGGVEILLGGNHRPDWVTTYPFNAIRPQAVHIPGHPATRGDVVIGNDVWLGQACTVISGVTIGDGAVVATRAVVAKDVPAYGIAVGNPARVVRHRFPPEQVEALLQIRWWDWPDDLVEASYEKLLSPNIEDFIAYARALSPCPRQTSPAGPTGG